MLFNHVWFAQASRPGAPPLHLNKSETSFSRSRVTQVPRKRHSFTSISNPTASPSTRLTALPDLRLSEPTTTSPSPQAQKELEEEVKSKKQQQPKAGDNLVVTMFRWPSQLSAEHTVGVTGSFNNWGPPLPLTRIPGGDWVRSIALAPGHIQFKFVVDGEYICSPCEHATATSSRFGAATNNHRLVQPTCEFTWSFGGHNIMVAGDWSGWGELLPLNKDPVSGEFSLRCCLPPGEYAYQFLVDGEWRLRPDTDTTHTSDGHFANVMPVVLPPAFRIYYSTGWQDASLKVRGVDVDGKPVGTGEWQTVALHDTSSRGHLGTSGRRWKVAKVPATGPDAPAALEFYPVSSDGFEDRPPGGGREAYLCPRPGGYKLRSGKVRPFLRASRPRIMLVSDLDGTLVGEDADADSKTADFGTYWEDNASLVGSALVYNTGRSLGQFQGLLEAKAGALPVPDVVISAVGTKIFLLDREGGTRGTASGLSWVEDKQWAKVLDEGWDLSVVRAAGAEAIATSPENTAHWLDDGSEHPHRIALSVRADVVPAVRSVVETYIQPRGVKCEIIISGNGDWRYVDVVSAQGGKLAALEYVRALFNIDTKRCVAAGDSGNDALMLGGANPAVVVGNAQDELLDWVMRQPQDGRLVVADAAMAHGVLEGLGRLGLY